MPHGENVLGALCHLEPAARVCMLVFIIEGLIEPDVTLRLRGLHHNVPKPVSSDSASDVALMVSW